MNPPPPVEALNAWTPKLAATTESPSEDRENFKLLAENANDGILIAANSGRFVYVNRKAADITGYTVDELYGIGFSDLAHPDELEKLQARHAGRLRGEAMPSPYETKIVKKDQSSLPIELSGARTTWQGQPAVVAIIRDISERKRAQQALIEANEALKNMLHRRTRELVIKSQNFEDRSKALKAFLERKEMEKLEIQEKLLYHVKEIVEPYLDRIRNRIN